MTDSTKAIVWDAVYTPFGQVHSITGTATNNQRFPGQYADAETGYSYNYFRDYDPTTGRYVQSDPIGLRGGLNTFGYVGGNPINFADPTGLIEPPGTPTPYNSGVAEAYGDATEPFFDYFTMDGVSEAAGNAPWPNCVRGCLLSFWDKCQKEYIVGGSGGQAGFVNSHAICFLSCSANDPVLGPEGTF